MNPRAREILDMSPEEQGEAIDIMSQADLAQFLSDIEAWSMPIEDRIALVDAMPKDELEAFENDLDKYDEAMRLRRWSESRNRALIDAETLADFCRNFGRGEGR